METEVVIFRIPKLTTQLFLLVGFTNIENTKFITHYVFIRRLRCHFKSICSKRCLCVSKKSLLSECHKWNLRLFVCFV